MESHPMFLDRPAYLDQRGNVRCRLPAHVERRFKLSSTNGSLESALISCPAGHSFQAPIEFLSPQTRQPLEACWRSGSHGNPRERRPGTENPSQALRPCLARFLPSFLYAEHAGSQAACRTTR